MTGSAPAVHAGVRRSRRLAERHSAQEACAPRAPRLDNDDAPQFDGPRPAWVSGQDTRSETLPPSPQRGAGDEPRVLPPLTQSAMRHLPTDEGVQGLGLAVPKEARHKPALHTSPGRGERTAAAEQPAFPSAKSTPDLGAEDWPRHEPLAKMNEPPTPRIGTLESGRFSPVLLPEPDTHLVPADHPEAEIPQRRSSRMQRTVTMQSECAMNLKRTSSAGVGLGIDVDPVETVTTSVKTMSLGTERRVALGDKSSQLSRSANRVHGGPLSDKLQAKAVKGPTATGKAFSHSHTGAGPVDENGCPIAYTIPTKRYTVPTFRKARSSTSQSSLHRERFTVACQARRTGMQPAIEVHARRTYTLR